MKVFAAMTWSYDNTSPWAICWAICSTKELADQWIKDHFAEFDGELPYIYEWTVDSDMSFDYVFHVD